MAHNVGLATAIGGTMFGREALEPALGEIGDRDQRDHVADTAWRRFSWLNLAGHAAVAATWFFGRSMLSGRSVSRTARRLSVAKDALVIASLATGIASVIVGRMLGTQTGNGAHVEDDQRARKLRRAVSTLGMANLAANIGVTGVTTALSMEGSRSLPFSLVSRALP
jgi:hypothetical protein